MTEPKRILILCADAGFGHRAAANAIRQALERRYGEACHVTVLNPLAVPRAPAILRFAQDDYDRVIRRTPELYRLGYRASDGAVPVSLAEQVMIVLLYGTLREVLEQHRPDVVVSTYPLYLAPAAAASAISRRWVPLIGIVTDLATVHGLWFYSDLDRCLLPTAALVQKALDAGISAGRVEVTGLPVDPRLAEPADRRALRAALGWSQDRIVALCVGSKRTSRLSGAVEVLNHMGFPLELALISGGDEGLRRKWLDTTWHAPAHVYGMVDNMPDMLRAADFVVCKAGGLIVSEALAAGLALLMVEAIPGQETGNAAYVVEGGAGALVSEPVEVLTEVCHWLDQDAAGLAMRRNEARKLGMPHAADRVAEIAWGAACGELAGQEHRILSQLPFLWELIRVFGFHA